MLTLCNPITRNSHPFLRHLFPHALTTTSAATLPLPPEAETTIANLVLTTDPQNLTLALKTHPVQWTPELVTKTLKRLWNHGPKSLQFFKTLTHLPIHALSAAAFDHVIDIAARLRDYRAVWVLVAQMKAHRLGPTPKTFAIITERYVAAGKPDKAVKIFLAMHHQGCPQDLNSFNTILDVLCKSRRVEKAYSLLKVFRGRFKADTISYNIIANGFCLVKRTPRALEVLREMVERGLDPTLITYNILLKGFFRGGQIKEAWEFFLQMKKRKCEIDAVTYTTVVHGFGVAGEVKKARKMFDEMIGMGVLPSVATYNALIQVLCKKDSVENAIVVFEEMLRKGYVPNSTTYNVLIRGLCHAGKMDRAREYMCRMKDDECEPNVQTYNLLVRYYCDDGEIEKGVEVFENMGSGNCLPNLDTYNILISAMFVRKKSDDLLVAGKLLIEMVDRGFLPRKFTFNRILNGLLLTGNQGFAKEILRLQSKCGRLPRQFRFFLSLYNQDGIETIGLDDAATRLGVERRRIYDIVNVLESVGEEGLRENGNDYTRVSDDDEDENNPTPITSSQEEKTNPSSHTRFSMASKTGKVLKLNAILVDNRKEKSLGLLTQNFIKLFLCTDVDLISLEEAAKILLGDARDPSTMRTKVRRLYDIANVLSSMNFIEKVHHPDTRKPAFRWLGMREKLEDGSANSFVPIESKKRTFGTEITNTSFKRTKVIDGNLNQITKPQMQIQVKREVLGNDFDKTNLEQDSRECSKSYQFGPFAPVSVSKAIAVENKKVKQVHDWESLASTFRPEYHNQALRDLFDHYMEAWQSWYSEVAGKKPIQLMS
ncbi:hypothetical protein RHGRI_024286 [Rhododendron griersonianum]|uniref:E2F/DP family winged-helix DNA-binding domain-containing protein n=1 Tax=Rhododendron griersonianum TaxID=479676 RepID=A0AAV6J923_9ERIC|nr:hypothetical protein RHGRI_024286 [Rhododendron griersonianum]